MKKIVIFMAAVVTIVLIGVGAYQDQAISEQTLAESRIDAVLETMGLNGSVSYEGIVGSSDELHEGLTSFTSNGYELYYSSAYDKLVQVESLCDLDLSMEAVDFEEVQASADAILAAMSGTDVSGYEKEASEVSDGLATTIAYTTTIQGAKAVVANVTMLQDGTLFDASLYPEVEEMGAHVEETELLTQEESYEILLDEIKDKLESLTSNPDEWYSQDDFEAELIVFRGQYSWNWTGNYTTKELEEDCLGIFFDIDINAETGEIIESANSWT